jgi:hypothetical protein
LCERAGQSVMIWIFDGFALIIAVTGLAVLPAPQVVEEFRHYLRRQEPLPARENRIC